MSKAKPSIFFSGIGGIGMSALARWFRAQGWAVAGSDAKSSELTRDLRREGIRVANGQKAKNIGKGTALVVRSQAIPQNNPELIRAGKSGIPIRTYPQVLGEVAKRYRAVAIAGSHGKSTTTALTGLILARAKLDPTVIVGTKLKEFGGANFREGKNEHLVLEADEFGGAFWHYSPALALITNIDKEHLDFYKHFAGVKKSFLKFIGNIKEGGVLVVNRDNRELAALSARIKNIGAKRKLEIIGYSIGDPAAKKVAKVIKIPGAHNLSNAVGAYALARALGIPEPAILRAIGDYRGAWRRMEYKGKLKINDKRTKILVFDDYAQHPAEIKATLAAFKEKYPEQPLVCVFQPHQAVRLKALFREFQDAFADADIALVLPAYNPRGRDKNDPKHDSEALVRAIQKREPKKTIFYLANPKNIENALAILVPPLIPKLHPPDSVLVMMGAGNIAEETKKLFAK